MIELLKRTEWYKTLQEYERILIFGARAMARLSCEAVQECGRDIECFVVSDEQKNENPDMLLEKCVKTFSEIKKDWKEHGLIIITNNYANEILSVVQKAGFEHIILAPRLIIPVTSHEMKKCCTISLDYANLGQVESVSGYCAQRSVLDCGTKNICIYAVTSHKNLHTAAQTYNSKYVHYIQAGSACADQRICEIHDDTGDNISSQNPFFCELTAGYWIYKNDTVHDYVGLYHYSRGLDMTDQQIECITSNGVDMVLPAVGMYSQAIVAHEYQEYFTRPMKAIQRVCPEYLQDAKNYYAGRLFFVGNIVFAKKKIFDDYYAWLFQVLDAIREDREKQHIEVEPRMWGYYAEHLTGIYFLRHMKDRFTLYADVKYMTK